MRLIRPDEFPTDIIQTPTEDLIEVYRTCLLIQRLCTSKRISGLSALQVGVPWALSVCCFWPHEWRYFLNYSYTPVSTEKKPSLVRFVNVEGDSARYFMVGRYETVEYRLQELTVKTQPELVEHVDTDAILGLFIQNECELLSGRFPHIEGEEYWLRQ